MNEITAPEIVINATLITSQCDAPCYEFILNNDMEVIACGIVESLAHGVINPIENFAKKLSENLFELNHVRVNPKLDNSEILAKFAFELEKSGVYIYNPPSVDLMAMCFKPLGELSEIVRFHLINSNQLVFLSKAVKLRAVK